MRRLLQIALRRLLCVCLFICASSSLLAQAGPPFQTDDPETPGNGNWEINFGFIGDRNPQGGGVLPPKRREAWSQAAAPVREAMSRLGDMPNIREYSRLNCDALS
jgi:hypothetical protein